MILSYYLFLIISHKSAAVFTVVFTVFTAVKKIVPSKLMALAQFQLYTDQLLKLKRETMVK